MTVRVICGLLALFTFAVMCCPVAAEEQHQIDCGSAKGKVEQLICRTPKLIEVDQNLSQVYAAALEKLSEERRHSFIKGEQKWLGIRDRACVLDDARFNGEHQVACIANVYGSRIEEIKEQEATEVMDKADYDAVLDKPIRVYDGMVAHTDEDVLFDKNMPVKTCREFYTLSSGDYQFTSDNRGGKQSEWTKAECAYGLLMAQFAAPPDGTGAQRIFSNISRYSDEFECVAAAHVCHEGDLELASFAELQRQKELKIIYSKEMHAELPDGGRVLIIDKNRFSDNLMQWSIRNIGVGNFTGQGRKEAIILVSTSAFGGSWGDTNLILAYYDDQEHMVRPEGIVVETIKNSYQLSTRPVWRKD